MWKLFQRFFLAIPLLYDLLPWVYSLSGATLITIPPVLLVIGGYENKNDNIDFFDDVQLLNFSQPFTTSSSALKPFAKLPKPAAFLIPLGRQSKIYLLGGSTRSSNSTVENSDIYVMDIMGKTIQSTGKKANMGYKSSVSTNGFGDSLPMALTFGGFSSVSEPSSTAGATTYVSTENGPSESLTLPSSPSGRQLSSLSTFNSTHFILTGGFQTNAALNDIYFFNFMQRSWSKSSLTLLTPRCSHRTLMIGTRFIVSIGGQNPGAPLIEFVDLNTLTVKAGNIVNPNDGPDTFNGGSLSYVQQDMIILFGATYSSDAKSSKTTQFHLLRVEPSSNNGGIQFRWVDSYSLPTAADQSLFNLLMYNPQATSSSSSKTLYIALGSVSGAFVLGAAVFLIKKKYEERRSPFLNIAVRRQTMFTKPKGKSKNATDFSIPVM